MENLKNFAIAMALFGMCFSSFGKARSVAPFKGGVSFQNNRIVGAEVGDVEGNRYFSGFDLEHKGYTLFDIGSQFSASARYTDADKLLFSVSEANLSGKVNGVDVTVGRKILKWSDIDHIWGFGILNNRQNFDFYTTGQEGLTGVMLSKRVSRFRASVFGSYLYIPELTPGAEVSGGKVSADPWVAKPPETIPFRDRQVDMYYTLKNPDVAETVTKFSIGAEVAYESRTTVANAFVIRKPENTPRINAEGAYVPEKDVVSAQITPEFVHHNVFGGTVGRKHLDYFFSVHYLGNVPDSLASRDESNNIQILDNRLPKHYVGLGASKTNDRFHLGLNYVQLVNNLQENDNETFKQRFAKAVNVSFRTRILRRFDIEFDFKKDLDNKDEIIQGQSSFDIGENVKLGVGFAFIAAPRNDTFWANFRGNDIAYANMSYRF